MRIDKVEIDGFGKLNNCEFTFADGVNLIYGENESGKSTLCEFILAMFYGLPNEGKRSGNDMAARKKYRPWNGEAFGGRLYFTDNDGREFVIERSFKGTKRGDKASLRDADTWEELDNSDDIGEKLFGLSREAFLKTLYVKSFGADSLKSDDGEIMSRLSNLETSGAEDVSYSKIINAMEKEIFSLKTKTGKGGKITALDDKILALNNELSISNMTYSALEADAQTAEDLKAAAAEKENEAKAQEEKYNTALLHEKYISNQKIAESKVVIEGRLNASYKKAESLIEQIKALESTSAPTVTADEISRARELETKKLISRERVAGLEKEQSASVKTANHLMWVIPVVAAVVLIAAGVLLPMVALTVGGGALLVLSMVMFFVMSAKKTQNNQSKLQELADAKRELKEIETGLAEIFAPYGAGVSDELSALFMASKNKDEKRADLIKQYKECEAEIKALKESIPEETDGEEYPQEAVEYSGESADVLFAKINMLKAESRQMRERAHEISVRIARETAEIRSEADIKAELDAAAKERAETHKRYAALCRAADWLNAAHDEIKNNFAPRLNQKASELLAHLTSEKYADIRANDSFDINLKSVGGEIVSAAYMSRGTYDLLYIALRLALMSVLTDGYIPPVVLDDAFSQLDDSRLLRAIDLIGKSSEFSQVLLFTCHENYKDILKNCHITELQ